MARLGAADVDASDALAVLVNVTAKPAAASVAARKGAVETAMDALRDCPPELHER